MIEILNRFLIQNKSISIPGLGTIHAERVAASVDAEQLQIRPPHYKFRFDKYFGAPDKNFFTYLSMQKQIPDYEAIRLYNQFAQDFRSGIKPDEKLEWEHIGFFLKNPSGEVEFFQSSDEQSDLRSVTLPSLEKPLLIDTEKSFQSNGPQEEVIVGEEEVLDEHPARSSYKLERSLTVAATIMLGLGLLAAGLHFGKYGFNWKAVANRQAIQLLSPK